MREEYIERALSEEDEAAAVPIRMRGRPKKLPPIASKQMAGISPGRGAKNPGPTKPPAPRDDGGPKLF